MKLSFSLAYGRGLIPQDTFSEIKIESKLFAPSKKKDDKTQVFLVEETPQIIDELYRRFYNNTKCTAPLGVIFTFMTGLRIGELAALKFSDVDGNTLHVQRQEVRNFDLNSDRCKMTGRSVEEHTKTFEGDRIVYLTEDALELLELVKRFNRKNHEPEDEWIFIMNGERIDSTKFSTRLCESCKVLGISNKSMHKIRKTYISALIDGGVNINEIRKQVGHANETTTYRNYCYNRFNDKETRHQIQNALASMDSKPEKSEYCATSEKIVIKSNQKIIDFGKVRKSGNPHKTRVF